jgi:molybdopterin molybdotransferase
MRWMNLTPMDEALQIIENSFQPITVPEVLPLEAAGGRILAEDVISAEDVPGFSRSTVDGYALRAEETRTTRENAKALFRSAGPVRMGAPASAIQPGECSYVPTGGMLPVGADAVIMVEYTEDCDGSVAVYRPVAPGDNCLFRGEDLRMGQVALAKGQPLRASEIGILASLGCVRVKVYRRPRVAVFSSGDELVPPATQSLATGQVRDSNGPALTYQARQLGATARYLGILSDDRADFESKLGSALREADLVILSGGSSVGTYDYTPDVFRKLAGGRLLMEGLAIQPGKPTLLANADGKALLGLPGHPVSALSVFALLGKALLRRLSGAAAIDLGDSYWEAVLSRNVPSRPGRLELVRVKLDPSGDTLAATPIFGRSGLLHTLAGADGMIRIEPDCDGLTAGTKVRVYPWR